VSIDYEVIVKGNNLALREGFLALANVTLVSTPDGPILFDVGHYCNRPALLNGLARRGVAPGALAAVFLSHLHFDHCNNIDLFRNAKVFVSRREWDYARSPHAQDIFVPWLIHEQLQKHKVEFLDGETRLAAGVRCLPAPGHTPGSYALVLDTASKGRVVLAGDAIKYAKETLTRCSDDCYDSPEASRASIERLLALGDRIVPGHFPELIRRDGAFVWDDKVEFPILVR